MRVLTKIFEPDDFRGDWYGWATNQISHIFLGVFAVFFLCLVTFLAVGELPYKVAAYSVVLFGYLAFEIFAQGWRGFDTLEDTVFVTAYGAGGVLSGFTEVHAGSPLVAVDVLGLAPFFAIAVLHLAFGALARAKGVA